MTVDTDPVHGHGWNTADRWGGWSWREPRYGDHFRTCSFCGSIHPDDLAAEQAGMGACITCGRAGWEAHFRALEPGDNHAYDPQGWYASWADRKYGWPHKCYVEGLKPRDPSLLHCVGHGSGPGDERPSGGGDWVRARDLTRAQKKIVKDSGMHAGGEFDGWYLLEPRATLHAKFYSVHLADPAVSQETKDKIAQVSGLRFHFADGSVRWEPYAPSMPSSF